MSRAPSQLCQNCKGNGALETIAPRSLIRCHHCLGLGRVTVTVARGYGWPIEHRKRQEAPVEASGDLWGGLVDIPEVQP